ncbi:antitoxin HicB [Rathayibacter sp. VKM Ac-2754]|uniref:antitoxin HicB n=1 Tax=Rathayibacter sp. VKM Ac-2754 TaxID=2609251 RepID=UPI001359A16B|nr:antitoxin HicB [Rathayibacter sp. VKM Ac-2754]MWV58956.1 antitoxin HicB [Rathayibacter sp. VKM Ac-2754]
MTSTERLSTTERTFEAVVTREGRWWMIRVEALDAVTQARSLREVPAMATGVVSALLDVDEDDLTIHLAYELPAEVAAAWREAESLRAQAEEAESRAALLRREAVRGLLSQTHMSQAEAGVVLGLSKQRVQQLAS